jgi:hypothetical protein
VFVVLTIAGALALACAPFLPDATLKRESRLNFALFKPAGISIFAVALLASIAGNTLWLYFEGIGEHLGMPLDKILDLGSYSLVPVLAVPWLAFQVHKRTSSVVPLLCLLALMATFAYYYATTHVSAIFTLSVFVLNATYMATVVYSRILAVDHDQSGRLPAAVGSADIFGLVAGPPIATTLLDLKGGYEGLGVFGITGFLLAIVPALIFALARKR